MWGTSSPGDKLTGDFGNKPDATSISDRGLFRLLAGNLSSGVFRLLQHNLPIGAFLGVPRIREGCGAPIAGRPQTVALVSQRYSPAWLVVADARICAMT